jgi:hypothetical protein
MIVTVDLSTVVVLAAISLSEGIGRVPAGALVLRRTLLGRWRVSDTTEFTGRLQLVHWWPPFFEALVVQSRTSTPSFKGIELQRRLAATSRVRQVARVTGAGALVGLVLGIPLGIGFAGWLGGLIAAAGVVIGQAVLAALGWQALSLLGASRRSKWRLVAGTLNPFAAPALASRILAAAVSGASPLTAARALLPPDGWAAWFRPRAYDARFGRAATEELLRDLEGSDAAISAILEQKPMLEQNTPWCPRCAATYQAGFSTCAECEIPLEGAGGSVPRLS